MDKTEEFRRLLEWLRDEIESDIKGNDTAKRCAFGKYTIVKGLLDKFNELFPKKRRR